jgi:hypothetical protein
VGILSETSAEVKNWISDIQGINEESLTDWALRHISRKSKHIRYHTFNHTEESRNGGDWAWCVCCAQAYYLFHVQAKKMKATPHENHRSLSHQNKNGRQIDLMIKYAEAKKWLPIYVFYSDVVSRSKCLMPFKDEGVYLANAYNVKELDDNHSEKSPSTTTNNISKLCIGLSCFERCPLICKKTAFEKEFENFVEGNLGSNSSDAAPLYYKHDYDSIPNFFKYIINSKDEKSQRIITDELEKEFSREIAGLSGIVVIEIPQKKCEIEEYSMDEDLFL